MGNWANCDKINEANHSGCEYCELTRSTSGTSNLPGKILKLAVALSIWFAAGCVAKQELILPNKHQRVSLVDGYKQCVANATNKRIHQNRDAEAIVRESMDRCRTSKYAMLKDYPKGWRDSYERQIDEEVLREEVAYVLKARNQR